MVYNIGTKFAILQLFPPSPRVNGQEVMMKNIFTGAFFCFFFVFVLVGCGEIGHIGETDGTTADTEEGSPDDPYKTADGQCREEFDLCLFHFQFVIQDATDSTLSVEYSGGGTVNLRIVKSSGGIILDEVFSGFFNYVDPTLIPDIRKKEIRITVCEVEFDFDTGTYECVGDPEELCPGQPFECTVR